MGLQAASQSPWAAGASASISDMDVASEDADMNHSADIPSVSVAASSQSVAEDMDADMNHSADSQSVAEDVDADSQSVAEDVDADMNHTVAASSQSVAEDVGRGC